MSATHDEGEASASPSLASGGLVGGFADAFQKPMSEIYRVFFGDDKPVLAPEVEIPARRPTRGEQLLAGTRTAIQLTARLCIVVTILAITIALCGRLLAWGL